MTRIFADSYFFFALLNRRYSPSAMLKHNSPDLTFLS